MSSGAWRILRIIRLESDLYTPIKSPTGTHESGGRGDGAVNPFEGNSLMQRYQHQRTTTRKRTRCCRTHQHRRNQMRTDHGGVTGPSPYVGSGNQTTRGQDSQQRKIFHERRPYLCACVSASGSVFCKRTQKLLPKYWGSFNQRSLLSSLPRDSNRFSATHSACLISHQDAQSATYKPLDGSAYHNTCQPSLCPFPGLIRPLLLAQPLPGSLISTCHQRVRFVLPTRVTSCSDFLTGSSRKISALNRIKTKQETWIQND